MKQAKCHVESNAAILTSYWSQVSKTRTYEQCVALADKWQAVARQTTFRVVDSTGAVVYTPTIPGDFEGNHANSNS